MNNTNIIPKDFKTQVIEFKNKKQCATLNVKNKIKAQYKLDYEDVQVVFVMRIPNKKKPRSFCIIGFDKENILYDLSKKWLKDIFYDNNHKEYYRKVLTSFRKRIPCPISHSVHELEIEQLELPRGGPKVEYQQGEKVGCVIYSLASALHDSGDILMAKVVLSKYFDSLMTNQKNAIVYIGGEIMHEKHFVNEIRLPSYQVKNLKGSCNHYEYIMEKSNIKILLIKVRVDHAVSIWNNFIYDSNYEHALPLTEKWLDYVSSNESCDKVKAVCEGIEISPPKRYSA